MRIVKISLLGCTKGMLRNVAPNLSLSHCQRVNILSHLPTCAAVFLTPGGLLPLLTLVSQVSFRDVGEGRRRDGDALESGRGHALADGRARNGQTGWRNALLSYQSRQRHRIHCAPSQTTAAVRRTSYPIIAARVDASRDKSARTPAAALVSRTYCWVARILGPHLPHLGSIPSSVQPLARPKYTFSITTG